MNRSIVLAAALLAAPALAQPAPPPPPKLNLAQETALRCSSAFAFVASEQAHHAPGSERYPALGTRGREFFVRTAARLMDQTGASRETVTALFKARFDQLRTNARKSPDPVSAVSATVRACLPLLDSEVPAK